MNIGERIKQLRTDKNLTQPQLAELANIEQSYLSKLENDKSIPSADILRNLLRALEADISCFLKGIDNDLIQKQLLQIPEIAVHLNTESRLRVRHVKRWLVGAAFSCAFGLALVFGGLKLLIVSPVSEKNYEYTSEGVILPGEPENLFEQWERDVTDKALKGEPFAHTAELRRAVQAANDEFRKRLHADVQQTNEYKGKKYKQATDNGFRIYYLREVGDGVNQFNLRANNWLAVLGAFLACGGFFGFIVEWRMRRL